MQDAFDYDFRNESIDVDIQLDIRDSEGTIPL